MHTRWVIRKEKRYGVIGKQYNDGCVSVIAQNGDLIFIQYPNRALYTLDDLMHTVSMGKRPTLRPNKLGFFYKSSWDEYTWEFERQQSK